MSPPAVKNQMNLLKKDWFFFTDYLFFLQHNNRNLIVIVFEQNMINPHAIWVSIIQIWIPSKNNSGSYIYIEVWIDEKTIENNYIYRIFFNINTKIKMSVNKVEIG